MDKGIISCGYIQKTMFDLKPEQVARDIAKEAVHADILGLVWPTDVWENNTKLAARFSNGALEAETEEMNLVDASAMEGSILD